METEESMTTEEALALLKSLVFAGKFNLEPRKARHASPVTKQVAKIIVVDLTVTDFTKHEKDKNPRFPGEYIWEFIAKQDEKYYLKFKFVREEGSVKFVSFHIATH
ncbi:type II toxin-antitoxin system MqsR family toxin [Leuconostoc lactis]|uniref:type II toxin-antitoxin system MqsR family toxin n=1 Tax=Leuconostoc lactis TaxID=1246 RepID=UPI001FA96A0F|nr:type II toxin-antitoxin system MqsR family toxin [Leuconostoc lactis]